jgi:methyl-accepting chemotaxis protein
MNNLFPLSDNGISEKLRDSLIEDYKNTDKGMLFISIVSFIIVVGITSISYETYKLGIIGGGILLGASFIAYQMFKGTIISRIIFGIAFSIYPSIMVTQQMGMIEMHFFYFVLVAALARYKDITAILVMTVVTGIHHISFTYLQMEQVTIMDLQIMIFSHACTWFYTFIHVIIYVFEVVILTIAVYTAVKQFKQAKTLQFESENAVDKLQQQSRENEQIISNTKDVVNDINNGILTNRINGSSSDSSIESLKDMINNMIDSLESKIGRDINEITKVMDEYTNHNFINRVDNHGQIGKNLNELADATTDILKENMKNGTTLQDNAKILLDNVNTLSSNSNTAAASLEETAAALEEVTSNVSSTTSNIVQMANYAKEVTTSVNKGQELASMTTQSMDEINAEVTLITEAITVIDQISFQTNILSLNAAVEAATAGEAGKGFAVVAGEVRNLASRSAEAANEIKSLVENATNKANNGKKISDDMIAGYTSLNENISKTIDLIGNIEKASKEQQTGITQINDVINSLDRQTQQNANVANQTQEIANATSTISDKIIADANNTQFKGKDEINKKISSIKTEYKLTKQKTTSQENISAKKEVKNIETSKLNEKIQPVVSNNTDDEWASF